MVTARQSNVAYITGKHRCDSKDLTPSEWREAIGHAAGKLTMGYMHGLQSAQQLMRRRHETREALWQFGSSQLEAVGLASQVADLLLLVELQPLPTWESWPKARKGSGYANVREKLLLYVRTKEPTSFHSCFKVLTVEWSLEVDEDSEGRVRTRRVHVESIGMETINRLDDFFEQLRSKARRAHVGGRILVAFHHVQAATAEFVLSRAHLAARYERELWSLMERAGVVT